MWRYLLICLFACSGGRGSSWEPGRSHVQASTVSIERLRTQLAKAISDGEGVKALTVAAQLEDAGEQMTLAEQNSLLVLADAVPAADLPKPSGSTAVATILRLRFALVAKHRGESGRALRLVEQARASGTLSVQVEAVAGRIGADVVDPSLVAVVLPMSGPHGSVGVELWAGAELAIRNDSGATVRVFDTKGTKAGAKSAIERAVAAGSVVALGPAGRIESAAAARAAVKGGLAVSLLAPGQGTDAQAGVFRLSLSPTFEAEQAALVAFELGYRLVAVLSPRDELGRQQAAAFVRASKKVGATVVEIGTYDPSTNSLEADLKTFLGLEPTVNARLRRHFRRYGRKSWKTFSPELGFDLLYIPDGVERASLVASYLPFYNVEVQHADDMSIGSLRRKHGRMPRVVQLMGSSGWIHPSLGTRGGAAVEGALLISTCYGAGAGVDTGSRAQEFAEKFEAEHQRPPSVAAHMAYDAMSIVLEARQWAAQHGGRRGDVARALRGARLRDGVCGSSFVNAAGQLEGEIEVLRVELGEPELFDY